VAELARRFVTEVHAFALMDNPTTCWCGAWDRSFARR
jgi:hypothetical protein